MLVTFNDPKKRGHGILRPRLGFFSLNLSLSQSIHNAVDPVEVLTRVKSEQFQRFSNSFDPFVYGWLGRVQHRLILEAGCLSLLM